MSFNAIAHFFNYFTCPTQAILCGPNHKRLSPIYNLRRWKRC
jgi:hypothetical protein